MNVTSAAGRNIAIEPAATNSATQRMLRPPAIIPARSICSFIASSSANVVGHRFAHHERWSPTPKRYRRTRQPSNSRRVGDSVHRLVRLGRLEWRRPCSQNLNHLGLEEIFKLSYSFLCGVTELRGKRVDLNEIQLLDILAQRFHLIARECIAILLGCPAFIQQS